MPMRKNKDAVRDAKAMARLIAKAAGWRGQKAALWKAAFVGEVRYLSTTPPLPDALNTLDDDLPF
jgi:hypothetical protein